MQLVAYGAQDLYLTGSPEVSFFKCVYKRHTNFAMECILQTTTNSPVSNGRVSVIVARNADLIGEMYIDLQVSNAVNIVSGTSLTTADSCWIAERAIDDIVLTIGGQKIDTHYQRWWRLYSELFLSSSKKINYGKLTSDPLGQAYVSGGTNGAVTGQVMLPLLFFFNRNPGLYLPLIALQYHEVKLDFDLSAEYSTLFTNTFNVWGNYVYLDSEERRYFAQKSHEYLIEQVQHIGNNSLNLAGITQTTSGAQIRLSYNQPVKELIWCVSQSGSCIGKQLWDLTSNASTANTIYLTTQVPNYFTNGSAIPIESSTGSPLFLSSYGSTPSYTWTEDGTPAYGNAVGPISSFRLILNGQDRFKDQSGKFFNQMQPYWHHSGTPYPGIYCYSFALNPEQLQPSGTCNFSRIDNAQVDVRIKPGINPTQAGNMLEMFAVNYNILRVQSGMGGLAFSN